MTVICKDCKHYGGEQRWSEGNPDLKYRYGCLVNAAGAVHPVTGEPTEIRLGVRDCLIFNKSLNCSDYEAKESK